MTASRSIVVMLLLCCINCVAQETIPLPRINVCQLPKGMRVHRVLLPNGNIVGWHPQGIGREPEPVLLDSCWGLEPMGLLAVFSSACANGDDQRLILKVNHLELHGIHMQEDLVDRASLNADLILDRDGVLTRLLNVAVNVRPDGNEGYFNDAAQGSALIGRVFSEAFRAFTHAWVEGRCDSLPVTEASLAEATGHNDVPLPVDTMVTFPKGVFSTLMDLRDGRVVPVGPRDISVGPHDHVVLDGHARELRDRCWGLSDGERIFVRIGDAFQPMERDELGFVAAIDKDASEGATALMVLGFGIIGGIVFSGAAGSEIQFRLDLMNGELQPATGKGGELTPFSSFHWIHYSRFAKTDEPMEIVCGDRAFTLDKGSYCVLPLAEGQGTAPAVIRTATGTLAMDLSRSAGTQVLHVIAPRTDGPPEEKKLNAQLRSATLERLTPEQRRGVRRHSPVR